MKSNAVNGKPLSCATLAMVMLAWAAVPGQTYERREKIVQPASTNVEASIIHKYTCTSRDENGGQLFIYEYTARRGFRVIRPPDWGHAIGGRDLARYQDAERVVAQACNDVCTRIDIATEDIAGAKRVFNDAYKRYMQNMQNKAAYNEYKCAEILLHHLERVALGGN